MRWLQSTVAPVNRQYLMPAGDPYLPHPGHPDNWKKPALYIHGQSVMQLLHEQISFGGADFALTLQFW